MLKKIRHVAVTGSAGQVAYQLVFRIANGELFKEGQHVILHLLDLPACMPTLHALKMELQDGAFPLLYDIEITDDPYKAFQDVDIALLVGAKPRSAGMERRDLLLENGHIFLEHAHALNANAAIDVKVFVVGNPCNTNCLIAAMHAPRLARKNFYAMTRLDQNRASFYLAQKANVHVSQVSHMIIWGNHSSTQVPDGFHAYIAGIPALSIIKDQQWLENDFINWVRQRGTSIIKMRGKSSAASAAHALIAAVHDILYPNMHGQWFSAAVYSEGNPYGIENDLFYSFPCYTKNDNTVEIVSDLIMNDFLNKALMLSQQELLEERDLIKSLLYKR